MSKSFRFTTLVLLVGGFLSACTNGNGLSQPMTPGLDVSVNGIASEAQPYSLLNVSSRQVLFRDGFGYASQANLDKVWASSTDYLGPIPMIYPAPTAYQLIQPGLSKSKQAVAAGRDGTAFSGNRFMLALRRTFTESRGFEGSTKRTLSFQYTPFVNAEPVVTQKLRPVTQVPTAPLVLEASQSDGKWVSLWDSRHAPMPAIYPAPTELAADVVLPAGNVKIRFVTVATKRGEVTPRIDNVLVVQDRTYGGPKPKPLYSR